MLLYKKLLLMTFSTTIVLCCVGDYLCVMDNYLNTVVTSSYGFVHLDVHMDFLV
jgi:hypothetical protein